jgi:hypothetical protein
MTFVFVYLRFKDKLKKTPFSKGTKLIKGILNYNALHSTESTLPLNRHLCFILHMVSASSSIRRADISFTDMYSHVIKEVPYSLHPATSMLFYPH